MAPAMDGMFDLDMALTIADEYDPSGEQCVVEAQAAAVDEMPTTVVTGGGECMVCMEELGEGGAAKQAACSHVFHQDCLFKWLSLHNSCPLCRRRLFST